MENPQKQNILPAAAERALKEAEERRATRQHPAKTGQREIGGSDGPDPTRYGDWEKGGVATDF